jgi:hypothetical protein
MTDQKRDESRDIGVFIGHTKQVVPWCAELPESFSRHVSHDDIEAAEQTIAEQKARIEELERHLERSGYDY